MAPASRDSGRNIKIRPAKSFVSTSEPTHRAVRPLKALPIGRGVVGKCLRERIWDTDEHGLHGFLIRVRSFSRNCLGQRRALHRLCPEGAGKRDVVLQGGQGGRAFPCPPGKDGCLRQPKQLRGKLRRVDPCPERPIGISRSVPRVGVHFLNSILCFRQQDSEDRGGSLNQPD